MNLGSHVSSLALITTAIGGLMVYAGLGKNALERRRSRRICPSCGRQRAGRACGCN
jgi:hypothetical protein